MDCVPDVVGVKLLEVLEGGEEAAIMASWRRFRWRPETAEDERPFCAWMRRAATKRSRMSMRIASKSWRVDNWKVTLLALTGAAKATAWAVVDTAASWSNSLSKCLGWDAGLT